MTIREVVGLILLIVSIILLPFGFWLSRTWYIVALVLACLGGVMFFTRRISEKTSQNFPDSNHLNVPIVRDELRGFPGGRTRDTHSTHLDIDGDGE